MFQYGGLEYRIERKLKGKNALSEAALYREGEDDPVAVQDRGVNELIESLLQLDYRSFTSSIFAEQKELDKLSSLQPEQRRQSINRLINIDRIDQARDDVRRSRNEKSSYVRGKKSLLKNLDDLKSKKSTISKSRTKLRAKEKENKSQVTELEKQANSLKKELEAISNLRDQFTSWETQIGKSESRLLEQQKNKDHTQRELTEISDAESELTNLNKQLEKFDGIADERAKLEKEKEKQGQLEALLREKKVVHEAFERDQANLNDWLPRSRDQQSLQQHRDELTEEEQTLEVKLKTCINTIKREHGKKSTAESKGKEIGEKLQRLETLGPDDECPVCTQPLGEHYESVVVSHRILRDKLRQAYKKHRQAEQEAVLQQQSIEGQLKSIRRDKEEVLQKIRQAQDAAKMVEQYTLQVEQYRQRLEHIETGVEKIGAVEFDKDRWICVQKQVEELLQVRQNAAILKERVARKQALTRHVQTLEKEMKEIRSEIEHARESQTSLGFDPETYKSLRNKSEKHILQFTQARDDLAGVRQELALLERDIETLKKTIDEQKQIGKEIEQTEDEIVYLNAVDTYLGQFRLELAGRIRPLIAHRASELLALTTTSRYSQLDLDSDYNIAIMDANQPFSIQRFSGGEQDLANLCLRIAISQVVAERSGGAPINFIVLDEIFGSQDSERRELILTALYQLTSQFRQIFIITHIEMIKDVLPVLINVEQINDFESTAQIQ